MSGRPTVDGGYEAGAGGALRRWLVLGAFGVALGAGVVAVGRPEGATGIGDEHTGSSPVDVVIDREALTGWCRSRLAAVATAEFIDRSWWCAGRPGGFWRLAPVDAAAACERFGRPGAVRVATDQGIHCDS